MYILRHLLSCYTNSWNILHFPFVSDLWQSASHYRPSQKKKIHVLPRNFRRHNGGVISNKLHSEDPQILGVKVKQIKSPGRNGAQSLCTLCPNMKVCDPVTDPVVAQRVGRGIALLFHNRGTRRWWVVSITPRPYFTPGKEPVPIVQEAG